MPEKNQSSFRMTALALALVLSACADMSGIAPAKSNLRDAPSLGLSGAEVPVKAQWWRDLGDEQLNALVDRALYGSTSLALAQARLARAQASTQIANSALYPHLSAGVEAERDLFTATSIYPPPLGGSIYNMATVGLNAGWEIDFFGKNRAALNAAIGNVRAAEADAQAARVMLASNLARAWVQWARIQAQSEIAQRTLAQREETLQLVRERQRAGLDTRLELRQSEGGLPEARQQIEALAEQAQLARHAIAALVGEPALAASLKPPELADLHVAAPALNLPANLLGQRADVVAARWRVEAATGDVANAKTQFYPNINLMASAGLSAIGFGRLHESGSEQWSVGPAVTLPLFQGGRLRANLRGKVADLDAAIESYNATVIEAVRDASDQAASSQSIARQQALQRQAQRATQDAYDIAVQRYKAGVGNYLQVLVSESAVLAQKRQGADLAARALETHVALMRALGGGYQADGTAVVRADRSPNAGTNQQ